MSILPEPAPLCEDGHGLMVPIETLFAYVTDGSVKALLTYYSGDFVLEASIYAAMSDGVPADLPLPGDATIGEQIQLLIDSDQLVEYGEALGRTTDVYRVDDNRDGRDTSYLVWLPTDSSMALATDMYLLPGRVYGHFKNGLADPGLTELPVTMETWQLMTLMQEAGITPIQSAADVYGDLEPGALLPPFTGLRVWDMGAMYRTEAHEK